MIRKRTGAGAPRQAPDSSGAAAASDARGRTPVTTDGPSETVVWSVGAEGDNRLRGFDGETGQVVFDGGGSAEAMAPVRRYQTPIAARGIFVAGDAEVYAFAVK
jgi:hypothetical protein